MQPRQLHFCAHDICRRSTVKPGAVRMCMVRYHLRVTISEFLPTSKRVRSGAKRAAFTTSEVARFRYRNVRNPHRAVTRLLLLTDFKEYTSDQQYAPIMRNGGEIYSLGDINSVVCDLRIAETIGVPSLDEFDGVGFKLSFRTPADKALGIAMRIKERISPSTSLIYFDGDDDLNIQWPEILDVSDVYVKKQVFRNLSAYESRYIGKSNLSDYVVGKFDKKFQDVLETHSGPVSTTNLAKIRCGWNIGLDDRIFRLAQAGLASPTSPRAIDICGRATADPDQWISPLRESMMSSLTQLTDEFRVAVPTERVPLEQYYEEMKSSSICVSPFGYGEICWRDFEAILSGCLLVKPDMGHVRTQPDIYVPGETYAPVAWDYSDLREVCSRYLSDDDARHQMVRRAQQVVLEALEPQWMADRLHHVLQDLDGSDIRNVRLPS